MVIDLLLGLVQGLTEWLPVSSEGIVTAIDSSLRDRSLGESVKYSLWLHVGTVFSVLIAFRMEVVRLVRDGLRRPAHPSPLLSYLVVTTIVSALIGFPLLVAIEQVSNTLGAIAMGLVGLFMLVTGTLQLRWSAPGERGRQSVGPLDAIAAGIAQGFAALPGLSRSGLTVSVLLARHVERREALFLSFLMSVPASLGAGIYSGVDEGFLLSSSALGAGVVACVVALITIRGLMSVAERVSFSGLVIVVGIAILIGAGVQALV